MKKLIAFIFCMIVTIMFCETVQNTNTSKNDTTKREYLEGTESFRTEGWINDDTFRVTAIGFPRKDMKSQLKRRFIAKEGAILHAQKSIVERFRGVRVKGKTTSKTGDVSDIEVSKEFEGLIKGGNIVSEKYDEEDNCQIVYEVNSPGLKARITLGVRE